MEFLVRTSNVMPADTPEALIAELRLAERRRAAELREQGLLVKLWRVPGTRDSLGLWRARDATEIHDALASLPMFAWMTISVEALATHPQEM